MTTIIPVSNNAPAFCSFSTKTGWRDHFAVGWRVGDDGAQPILYPTPSKGAGVFIYVDINKRIDVKTGQLYATKAESERAVNS